MLDDFDVKLRSLSTGHRTGSHPFCPDRCLGTAGRTLSVLFIEEREEIHHPTYQTAAAGAGEENKAPISSARQTDHSSREDNEPPALPISILPRSKNFASS